VARPTATNAWPNKVGKSGSFDELAVLEYRAGTDQRDDVGCVDGPPPDLC